MAVLRLTPAEREDAKGEPTLEKIAAQIRYEHNAATNTAKSALRHAMAAGDLLLKAKAQVPHGEWLGWLSDNCPMISVRTAQAYMQIARQRPKIEAANAQCIAHLSFTGAMRLAQAPKAGTGPTGDKHQGGEAIGTRDGPKVDTEAGTETNTDNAGDPAKDGATKDEGASQPKPDPSGAAGKQRTPAQQRFW